MSAWLLMTQEASELLFDRGSPSQTRVHKKRTTGRSLSCWTGTLACDVAGEDWTEEQQLLVSRASHLSLSLTFCHQREVGPPQDSEELLWTHQEWVKRAQQATALGEMGSDAVLSTVWKFTATFAYPAITPCLSSFTFENTGTNAACSCQLIYLPKVPKHRTLKASMVRQFPDHLLGRSYSLAQLHIGRITSTAVRHWHLAWRS